MSEVKSIRDRFKGAKVSTLKETRKDAEKKSKTAGFGEGRPGFHSIDEGKNIFRIAPPHGENEPSYQPLRTAWLKCDLPKLDDNGEEVKDKSGNVVTEMKKKRIFIATIHSDVVEKDPIEVYIEYVYKRANDEFQDKKERETFLAPITGWRDKKGTWNPGMRPSTNYVFYAWKGGDLGRVEVYPSILKEMEKITASTENSDEIMETDCFSDPDDGVSLVIDYDPKGEKNQKYIVSKKEFDFSKYLSKYKGDEQRALDEWKADKLCEKVSDKQLEELSQKESLSSMYKDSYTMRDFELALNGLKIFDDENGFEIFQNDDFLTALEEIQGQVPLKTKDQEVRDGDDIDKSFNGDVNKKLSPKVTSSPNSSQVSETDPETWSKIKCRKFLESYIMDNYGNDKVLPELELEDMRKWCELGLDNEELPFDSTEQQSTDDGTGNETEPEAPSTPISELKTTSEATSKAMSRIEELRKKREGLKE